MCCLITHASCARSLSINVYLKLKPTNQVSSLITDFNHFLQQKKILSQYHIHPFINTHPLHITLYLTTYEEKYIPEIMKQTQTLAKQQKKIPIATGQFVSSENGYVMLSVGRSEQLQQLSDRTVNILTSLHDKKALIPAWAAQNPQRSNMFYRYGSPGVMNYFNPHFSIFDREKQNAQLEEQLKRLITQFSSRHSTQVKAMTYSIGVGIADAQGQIVKELAEFELK